MPVFKVQYVRRGECEIEAASESEAQQAVADMDANGDACVSFGDIEFEHVEEMIHSIEEFVKLCDGKDRADIHTMYVERLSAAVRDELYQYSKAFNPSTPDPVRLVINTLGGLHNIQSMKDY